MKFQPTDVISKKGRKSVVLKGVDEYGSLVAIKLATYDDYKMRSYLQEATRARKLRQYSQFARFEYADFMKKDDIKLICFIEEYVEGYTLDQYLKNNEISPSFILDYIRQMCNILNILKANNFRHNDLHFGNIMISKPPNGSLYDASNVKIIDMGSLKFYDDVLEEEKYDDHEWFTVQLKVLINFMLLNNNSHRRPLSLFERNFRENIIPLVNSMLEEDKQVALIDPSKIVSQFQRAYTKAGYSQKDSDIILDDPFDYISAEHIASDKLLVNLFANSCPWVKEVTSPNPVLLTGPRGCGKSMLFRRLGLKALLCLSTEDLINSRLVGFYISCSADFSNRFGRIFSESYCERFKNEIIHYFNLLLSREIIQTLLFISRRDDRVTLFGFGEEQERELYIFLIGNLKIKNDRRIRLQGVTPLENLSEIIQHEMYFCYNSYLEGKNIASFTPASFLSDLTKFLKYNIGYFKDRAITFLLDDFSIHRISEPVQLLLNSVIWDRQPTHIFKLSAEKYGAETVLGSMRISESSPNADITREFIEIDCGQYYISLSDKKDIESLVVFAKELLDHRLSLSKYIGRSETLIGHSIHKKGSLAKAIRNKESYPYHGIEMIAEICSGDVSALLEIYRRIFKDGKVTKETNIVVKKQIQHDAITSTSRSFLVLIKTFHPHGQKMYQIVESFGTLCRKILTEGREYSRGIPNETTRIEVDEQPNISEDLTEDQGELIKELFRRSIFIDMQPGRGRHTLGPTQRWQLRRIYCPAFLASLKKNNAIKWSPSELKYFILDPKEKCDIEFQKWIKRSKHRTIRSKKRFDQSIENFDSNMGTE
jgi:serine/threonine protein kinase